jgi:hypothetical protein
MGYGRLKMQTIFRLGMGGYFIDDPKSILEVIGASLLGDLRKRYPAEKGYAVNCVIHSGAGPFATRWDIYLTRGKFWRFKLSVEVSRTTEKLFFYVSIGRNLSRKGTCFTLGMMLSLIGLTGIALYTHQPLTIDIIAAILTGTIIIGFIISLPIRLIIRPYVMMNARKEGLEKSELILIEEVKEVLRRRRNGYPIQMRQI